MIFLKIIEVYIVKHTQLKHPLDPWNHCRPNKGPTPLRLDKYPLEKLFFNCLSGNFDNWFTLMWAV